LSAYRADTRLDDDTLVQAERRGGLFDTLSVPDKPLRQAGVAEPLVGSGLKERSYDRGFAFGPDIAIEVDNFAVVKDHRNCGGDCLTADRTNRIWLVHSSLPRVHGGS
jgi:hypothetical protein